MPSMQMLRVLLMHAVAVGAGAVCLCRCCGCWSFECCCCIVSALTMSAVSVGNVA